MIINNIYQMYCVMTLADIAVGAIRTVKLKYEEKRVVLEILFEIAYSNVSKREIIIQYKFDEKIKYLPEIDVPFSKLYVKDGENDINDIINWYFKNFHIGIPPYFDKCKTIKDYVQKNSWLQKMVGGKAILVRDTAYGWRVLTPFVCE